MFRSTFQIDRRLSEQLLQLPDIVRQFERKSPGAMPELMQWIDSSENMLSGYRMTQAADLAGLKALIIAPAFEDDTRGKLRRRQQAVAVGLLHQMQDAIQQGLRPHALKMQQSRELVRQLLQVVAQSGAVHYDAEHGVEALVEQIWALCIGHEQLKPIAAQLRTLLSHDDIRLLLVEEVDPIDFVTE